MSVYQLAITQASPHSPPVAEVYTECTAAGCTARYVMPTPAVRLRHYPAAWLDAHRPRYDDINYWAGRTGWTYTDAHGSRCGAHPYGKPVAALEAPGVAHRREQIAVDTAAFPVVLDDEEAGEPAKHDERDHWQEHKDDVAMGYIDRDGSQLDPPEPDWSEVTP